MTIVAVIVAVVALVALAVSWRRNSFVHADLRARERMLAVFEERLDRARTDIFRFTAAFDEVPQGVVFCDANGQMTSHNVAARDFVRARHAEALVEQAIVEELRGALEGAPRRRTLDLVGPPRRMLVITAAPLSGGGAVAVVDDVSERRRLDAMRRDFVANISHELKTPVGALGVLAEAIADADDPADVTRLAERMTGEAQRVGRIIDDLLALTHIESEDDRSDFELVSMAEVVRDAVERVQPLADARRTRVDVAEVDEAHVVSGDRRQLVSAVTNLVENACKYSDEGAVVTVRTRTLGSWLELEVEDVGVGIPSSDLDRIFERFYRVDRARSRDTGGTGLGLAIVRHVATNHGGDVHVRSSEGSGSTFTLRLRADPVAAAP